MVGHTVAEMQVAAVGVGTTRVPQVLGQTYEGHLLNPIGTPASSIDCRLFIETGDFQ
jgi:hypothetical protein